MTIKFIRRNWNRFSRLGMGRKKKQKWRNPTGRHNKIREKIRGHPAPVSIGYKKGKNLSEKKPAVIYNLADLEKVRGNAAITIGKIGKRKKIEIIKKAIGKKIRIQGISAKKFIGKNEKMNGKKLNKLGSEGKK